MSSYSFAANQAFDGYMPPGYNKLRTTLIQQEKVNVECNTRTVTIGTFTFIMHIDLI